MFRGLFGEGARGRGLVPEDVLALPSTPASWAEFGVQFAGGYDRPSSAPKGARHPRSSPTQRGSSWGSVLSGQEVWGMPGSGAGQGKGAGSPLPPSIRQCGGSRSPPAIVEPPRFEQPLKTSAKSSRHRPAATFSYSFFFFLSFPFPLSRWLICCYYQPFPYGHFN